MNSEKAPPLFPQIQLMALGCCSAKGITKNPGKKKLSNSRSNLLVYNFTSRVFRSVNDLIIYIIPSGKLVTQMKRVLSLLNQ